MATASNAGIGRIGAVAVTFLEGRFVVLSCPYGGSVEAGTECVANRAIHFCCFENLCAEGTLECGGLTPPSSQG
jgi:hypothetical protein